MAGCARIHPHNVRCSHRSRRVKSRQAFSGILINTTVNTRLEAALGFRLLSQQSGALDFLYLRFQRGDPVRFVSEDLYRHHQSLHRAMMSLCRVFVLCCSLLLFATLPGSISFRSRFRFRRSACGRSSWSQWAPCSASCGTGEQTRTRTRWTLKSTCPARQYDRRLCETFCSTVRPVTDDRRKYTATTIQKTAADSMVYQLN